MRGAGVKGISPAEPLDAGEHTLTLPARRCRRCVRYNPEMKSIDRYGYAAARVMLAAIFLLTGFDKLIDVGDAASDIAKIGLPLPTLLAVVAGLVELVCGALLALGRRTEWAAAGLLLFLAPVTVLMENPLRADADFGTVIDFLKNLAIMGGLLMVVRAERGRQEESR